MTEELKFNFFSYIIGRRIFIFCERFSMDCFVYFYFITKAFSILQFLLKLYRFYNTIESLLRTAQQYVILYVNFFMQGQREEKGRLITVDFKF